MALRHWAAAAFVDQADLTQYALSGAMLTRFEITPKDNQINLRLSAELYDVVRQRAARAGVPSAFHSRDLEHSRDCGLMPPKRNS